MKDTYSSEINYLIKIGIPEKLINDMKIENICMAKAIVDGYDWKKRLGRDLDSIEEKAIIQSILRAKVLSKEGHAYLTKLIENMKKSGKTEKEAYGVIINLAINKGLKNQSGYNYTTVLINPKKIREVELTKKETEVTENTVLRAVSEHLDEIEKKKIQEYYMNLGMSREKIETRGIRNIYLAREIVRRYDWENLLEEPLNEEEEKNIVELIIKNEWLKKEKGNCLNKVIHRLEQEELSDQEIYGTIINLASNAKQIDFEGLNYSSLLGGTANIEGIKGNEDITKVSKTTVLKVSTKMQQNLMKELARLKIANKFFKEKKIENVYMAIEIVESYNWKKNLGRKLTKKEERNIIQTILNKSVLDKDKCVYLEKLEKRLRNRGLSKQDASGFIINLAINGGMKSQSGCEYSRILTGDIDIEELEIDKIDTTVNKNTIIKVNSNFISKQEEHKIKNELMEIGIPEDFLEEKAIKNIYMAKAIVEGYDWEKTIGNKLDSEDKKNIIQAVLHSKTLNEGKSIFLSRPMLKLERLGLSEQEIYATIINLGVNRKLIGEKAYTYQDVITKRIDDEMFELSEQDTIVTRETVEKAGRASRKIMKKAVREVKGKKTMLPLSSITSVFNVFDYIAGEKNKPAEEK